MTEKIKVICVVGATASGKTALGVEIAKAIDGEIISADSMQVYKNMPVATAVATADEQQGVPHHLIEFLDNDSHFSVADFVALAKKKIFDINARGKTAVIVGGTGLFIDSLIKNIVFADVKADSTLRATLEQKTNDELYNELLAVDKTAAEDIHKNNRKRVIRALELYYAGTTKTQQNEDSTKQESPFDALYIGVGYADRNNLYQRINKRVDSMLENGLLDEAKNIIQKSTGTSNQAIGHKELKPYLDGEIELSDAVDNLKKATRHYAKRQLTWFRRNDKIQWLYADKMDYNMLICTAVDLSKSFLKKN